MGTRVQNSRNSNAPTDVDEKLARQKEIDDWLPVTSSRNAKWWYSAFHNVTAIVGAGVLSLPYAMSELGWGPGVAVLVMSWIITWYTLWQMVEMHEMVPGKRFDRYHELGQHAPSEKSLVSTLCYSTIAWGASVHKGVQSDVDYGHKAQTTAGNIFSFFSALGDVAFAYAGHNVVLEIQATIPSTPEKPSKGLMWRGVIVAYIVVALCYFPVALIGYWILGNKVEDNVLITFVVVHVIGGYQIFAMPVFDMIETVLVKKLNFRPSFMLRFVTRNLYVGILYVYCLHFFEKFEVNFAFMESQDFTDQKSDIHINRNTDPIADNHGNKDEQSEQQSFGYLERQKDIDDWLPITSSRNAKWWYAAFHNVTAMVGAGVLSLPFAMSQLGWGPGVVILILSWVITFFTLWQMVEMHEMVPGKRFDRYHELGQHAFGEKLGLWIVVPQQLICEVGVDIVYMVTGGKSLQKVYHTVCGDCNSISLTEFILIFASPHFVLAHLPNFNSISGVSLAAAVMSLSYSTIAWTASVHKGVQHDVTYGRRASSDIGAVFNFLSALGDVAFAYAGHNVVLEIQATIPSTPEKPSKRPMWRGVVLAYIVVALCYFPVALIGYYVFGDKVEDNILISLEKPKWLIIAANMFVVVHVIGSYQLYAMPVFDMIETVLVKKLHFRPTWYLRFISRNLYVAFTFFIAITFPFFGGLLGFFGGFAFSPTTYFLPCIMWLAIYKPKTFSLSWCVNWICIILGLMLMILSPIGGLRSIILQAKNYQFYS
ncbi:hypothetical protein TIFTF001_011888 [Ficus carica]|uniref:Amino acid transporter transmembrane domain-containing protein n=1 Tax=Ficus carica TaxID=3494 RepID=A0AA87ZZH6_FICCA|nr:hypothetical protein TIFTF001_011888 [Ficus carica]